MQVPYEILTWLIFCGVSFLSYDKWACTDNESNSSFLKYPASLCGCGPQVCVQHGESFPCASCRCKVQWNVGLHALTRLTLFTLASWVVCCAQTEMLSTGSWIVRVGGDQDDLQKLDVVFKTNVHKQPTHTQKQIRVNAGVMTTRLCKK